MGVIFAIAPESYRSGLVVRLETAIIPPLCSSNSRCHVGVNRRRVD